MKNIVWKLLLILVILGLCAYFVYPPGEKIRLGKDLRGGVSLIYSINIDPDESDPQAIIAQTISVLQDRINPQGVLDISMEPLGNDRIEVVMPLPSPEVQELRRAYENKQQDLLARAQISPSRLDAALRANAAPAEIGGETESERGRLIAELQEAYNDMQAQRDALREAQAAGELSAEELALMEQRAAESIIAYEDRREQVLRLSLERSRLIRVLGLERQVSTRRERAAERDADLPALSPRAIELANLKEEFPHLRSDLQDLVESYDAYQSRRTALDDPEDLKRLLRGAGVLNFRIAVRPGADDVPVDDLRNQFDERGPENVDSPVARWHEINDLRQWYETPEQLEFLQQFPSEFFEQRDFVAAERDSRYYLLLYHTPAKSITHDRAQRWSVIGASRGLDQAGRPAVDFRLDSAGGALMSRLTGPHIGEPMAIVLDDEVFSAPTLQGQIANRGQITGTFTRQDIDYLIRVLASGALQARLSENPIAENTLGPSIGQDNLERGMNAFVVAIFAVAIFMIMYYFFSGLVAVIALFANALIIFGAMAMMQGTFTLPGLAGIVLTIGMAVDANVLIYERIREEMFEGELDLRGCIRQGYNKALSTILDANITNLIVCLVLFQTATTEVKGFALTLTIGICATLFTCLFLTRQIFYLYTDFFKVRRLPMLPTIVPAIHHFLEPSINWIGLRRLFWTISSIAVVGSVLLVASRGVDMFDTELRGGVAVTFHTVAEDPDDPAGPRRMLAHVGPDSVEARLQQVAEETADPADAPDDRERMRRTVLREFANASILTVGDTRRDAERGVLASTFQIKVPNPRGMDDDALITDIIVESIVETFGDDLDVTPPVRFEGTGTDELAEFTFPIEHEELGQNIGDTRVTDRVPEYVGGVAVVLRNIEPPISIDEAERRIARMRSQPDFSMAGGRESRVIGVDLAADGERGFRSLVIVVSDPNVSYLRSGFEIWNRQLAEVEWRLASEAFSSPPSLEQIASFSPAVARTLAAAAQVAVVVSLLGILMYIWIRFGSLRYSAAAIVALVHDVCIALGVLALTAFIARTALGNLLLIDEFRIDLGVVAALLTIIGYSLNDTIVILDRIRENRGKMPLPTAETVNRSINQTISRTVLTSTTTIMAVLIMYFAGGSGIRVFAFTLLIGLVVGTYSSVAIAAPLVFSHRQPTRRASDEELDEEFDRDRDPLAPGEDDEGRPALT